MSLTLDIKHKPWVIGERGLINGIEAQAWRESNDFIWHHFAYDVAQANGVPIQAYRKLLHEYDNCVTVFWRSEMRMAAIAGREHFMGKMLDASLLHPPKQFWVYAEDLAVTNDVREAYNAALNNPIPTNFDPTSLIVLRLSETAMASIQVWQLNAEEWTSHDVSRRITEFYERTGHMPEPALPRFIPIVTAGSSEVVDVIPEARETIQHNLIDDPGKAGLAAMIEFMNQEIAGTIRERLSRPERRRRQKADHPRPDPEILTITLRRKAVSGKSEEGLHDVDWACRWIVSGHWRRQWYPSEHTNKPIFIAPYVKGPDDKPLKSESAKRIYQVAR